jgi:hypothetical protein
MADLWGDATDPYRTTPEQPGGLWGRALNWLYGDPAQPQAPMPSAAELYRAMGKPMPPSGEEAARNLYGMTGIPDIQAGAEAFQRGEYPQALGQAGAGAANLASLAFPAARGALGLGRELAPAVAATLADTRGGGIIGKGLGGPTGLTESDIAKLDRLHALEAENAAPEMGGFVRRLEAGEAAPGFGPRAAPEAKFPQYAEVYPPTGPPVIKINAKGNPYPSKELTPEAEDFQKERLRIMADMKQNGYEPYFNPADRFYVDPANYPPANVDTSTVVPKKQATIDKYLGAINAPETTAALHNAYAKGLDLGNADHWYAMGQLEAKHIGEFGETEGRKRFLDTFAVPMSATTSGNDPRSNFLMAHYLEYLRQRGEPIPTEGYDLPYPVGGRRGGVNLENYAAMRAGGGYDYLGASQPKMHDFTRSFIGDLSHGAMDEQMVGGMLAHAPGLADPARKTAYGMVQQPLHAQAEAAGVLPGNYQGVAWAGFRNEPGQPMISVVNDAIERTHRLTGMPRDEIVRRGLVRKEIPIYGLLGAVGAGAAADQ